MCNTLTITRDLDRNMHLLVEPLMMLLLGNIVEKNSLNDHDSTNTMKMQ
jgi:hypothetical protein